MKFLMQHEPTMLQILGQRFYTLVFVRSVDFAEVWLGCVMAFWGMQLAAPWQSFSPTSATFGVLASIPPYSETYWGVLFLSAGVFKVISYFSANLMFRVLACIVVSSLWAFVAGAFGWANPTGTGIIAYFGYWGLSFWVLCRLIVQAVKA